MTVDHQHWAEYLLAAVDQRTEVDAITASLGELAIGDAYAIQAAGLKLRLDRGEVIVGAKLGLTSEAKQKQMNVDSPVFGWVTSSGLLEGPEVRIDELIHPRAEPEIVFIMQDDLEGPDVTADDVLDATRAVVGGIEVIDSRFKKFSFTLPDVIADNTSAARVAIGSDGVEARGADLTTLGCLLEVDGNITGTATGAALLGDPAACVALLVSHLSGFGEKLHAGWFVMAGAATDAQPLNIGTSVTARYSHLGSVRIEGI